LVLVDTHCHLDFQAFDEDREAVLARAWEAGLVKILIPGVDLASSQNAIRLAETHPQLRAAVGVHPNEALAWDEDSRAKLQDLIAGKAQPAGRRTIVAVGEIGLDYYRQRTPPELQKRVFREQLDLAAEMELPVIIHNRQASQDVLAILSEWHINLVKCQSPLVERPGVLHSFSASTSVGQQAIAMNFYIGFTGPVTFRNAPELQNVAALIPLSRLLIETDAPFLAPHPLRGKRNEPANVRLVAEKIAEIHRESLANVAKITTENAKQLFMW
jgi:TatD DNase family protein